MTQSFKKYDGIVSAYRPFFYAEHIMLQKGPIIIVMNRDETIFELYEQMQKLLPEKCFLLFPAWDCLPYDRVSPSAHIAQIRLKTLLSLLDDNKAPSQAPIIITSVKALCQRLMSKDFLKKQTFTIKKGQKIVRQDMLDAMLSFGFERVETVFEAGEFAVRGSLIDIFPTGSPSPYRLDFFDTELEWIKKFDPLTQRTEPTVSFDTLTLQAAHEVLLNTDTVNCFKNNYRQYFGSAKNFPHNDPFYNNISEYRPQPGMEHWLPLFFTNTNTLLDYVKSELFIIEENFETSVQTRLSEIHDYYMMRKNPVFQDTLSYNPIEPHLLYWTAHEVDKLLSQNNIIQTFPFKSLQQRHDAQHLKESLSQVLPLSLFNEKKTLEEIIRSLESYLHGNFKKNCFICCQSLGSKERILKLFEDHNFTFPLYDFDMVAFNTHADKNQEHGVGITIFPLDDGFETVHSLVIAESNILGQTIRKSRLKSKKNTNFFQEITQLNSGDIVVHRNKGICRYLGLEPVVVDSCPHDCLTLEYEGGDKLFLPVENIELLSRYGDADSSITLDKLGSHSWQNKKRKVQKRLQAVADYLIQLAAERSLKTAQSLDKVSRDYDDFCAKFPYVETEDQLAAIEDVLEDLSSGKPMDRLVCGDVGFGKTEVALRAAFVAAMNGKQVAVVVPTTLLCRQHFLTFSKRFQGFGYEIRQLSRLVAAKEATQTFEGLKNGKVDIVIATHAILSQKTKFNSLGLLVIDEEQHFGVKQKEKLKAFKSDVHVLTLTATPIPRTLQLSLSGVRDLSLITTPPVDRLAVRTFVGAFDSLAIRDAILREYNRGGQIFYVTPRLEDMPALKESLNNLVPEIKIGMAHGQLSATALEDIMTQFYDRHFDVLLSTNIIESGIDIPNANTLIIHKCDLFGLSQLYQLRGRVGRSKTQGYAYFTYPQKQELSFNATKRLHVLQNLDTLGAGFTLASHDLDIRGAGNIVGEAQSGHIREVGVELYQTLLQEAILATRSHENNCEDSLEKQEWVPQINLGLPVLIPDSYISDLGLRLNLYRRISYLKDRNALDAFSSELVDRFGKLPLEVSNLLDTVELKVLCTQTNIEKLDAGSKGLLVTFHQNQFKAPEKLMAFLQRPEVTQLCKITIRPDHKILFVKNLENPAERKRFVLMIVKSLAKLIPSSNDS